MLSSRVSYTHLVTHFKYEWVIGNVCHIWSNSLANNGNDGRVIYFDT